MSYDHPDVPEKQWEVVRPQLEALRAGNPPEAWDVLGKTLVWLQRISDIDHVHLLDAGCSSGYYSEVVKHYVGDWATYTGIDSSSYMVSYARKQFPGITIFRQDILDMPAVDQAYDIVMTGATVNHILFWERAIGELARVCKRWLVFHRLPLVSGPTRYERTDAYGYEIVAIFFKTESFMREVEKHGFSPISVDWYLDSISLQVWERA